MKTSSFSCLAALVIACATAACSASGADPLSDKTRWSEDFTRLSPPTPECPGGSLAALKTRMSVIGPYTLESFERMAARTRTEDQNAGTTTLFPYSVSALVRARMKDSERIHGFDFATDPNRSPWWGFHGVVVTDGDCIIHVEITGYDHG